MNVLGYAAESARAPLRPYWFERRDPRPNVGALIHGNRGIAGSNIGGISETQEMLDFCAKHGVEADIELIKMQDVNEAYQRMVRNDVKYRFVIDMASLKGGR
jgi:uncharacterized zinc-type alcohol dehydrogenase-like protein